MKEASKIQKVVSLGLFLKTNKDFCAGFVIATVFLLLSILSLRSPYDPRSWSIVPGNLSPSLRHPFGTTSTGQDLFWIMTYAVRNSLLLGGITTLLSRILAVVVATVAGHKGGIVDRFLMSINDGLIVIPVLPILVLLSFIRRGGMSITELGVVLAVFGWAWDSRLIRSRVLSLREREFVYTAIFSGLGVFRLILEDYMPFVLPLAVATSITNLMWAIGMEITLSVFGLLSLETSTFGTIIRQAQEYQALFLGLWWWFLIPVLFVILLFVGLYILSTAVNRLLDPRTRLRMMEVSRTQ